MYFPLPDVTNFITSRSQFNWTPKQDSEPSTSLRVFFFFIHRPLPLRLELDKKKRDTSIFRVLLIEWHWENESWLKLYLPCISYIFSCPFHCHQARKNNKPDSLSSTDLQSTYFKSFLIKRLYRFSTLPFGRRRPPRRAPSSNTNSWVKK